MKIGIPTETHPAETRVAAVPETIRKLTSMGLEPVVQAGAGEKAFCTDGEYEQAGARIAADAGAVFQAGQIILKVGPPSVEGADGGEVSRLASGTVLVALLAPARSGPLVRRLAEGGVTSFSLDMIPRITRAQSMDVLSSMSTLAGYKAALLAANELAKILPMMMTAAGTIRPATALVIGAGVAGLQAIATLKRLGAVVTGVDVRPAAAEQVESLGAKFVVLEADHSAQDAGGYATDLGEDFYRQEQEVLAPHVQRADMVITTALIPGRAAPILLTKEMVESMHPGSVIVDLAAAGGGNCSLTKADERVAHGGVAVLGPTNLPGRLPIHASVMFSRNAATFLGEIVSDGEVRVDRDNEVVGGTLITHDGEVVHEAVRKAIEDSEVQP